MRAGGSWKARNGIGSDPEDRLPPVNRWRPIKDVHYVIDMFDTSTTSIGNAHSALPGAGALTGASVALAGGMPNNPTALSCIRYNVRV